MRRIRSQLHDRLLGEWQKVHAGTSVELQLKGKRRGHTGHSHVNRCVDSDAAIGERARSRKKGSGLAVPRDRRLIPDRANIRYPYGEVCPAPIDAGRIDAELLKIRL